MTDILYFGRLEEAAGCARETVSPPANVATTEQLRQWLSARNPVLATALNDKAVRIVLNHEIVQGEAAIAAGDEVAFIPPVSGG